MHNINPFFKYGWLINIIAGAMTAGMIYKGVLLSQDESASNSLAIVDLKIGQAKTTQQLDDLSTEVHQIAHWLGVKK